MWSIPWSIAMLLLGFPYAEGAASRFLLDMAPPPLQQWRSPSPSPLPPPPPPLYSARWPSPYHYYYQPPPPMYHLSSPPAKTPFKFSLMLLALPLGSIVVLFICTYVRTRCKHSGAAAPPASNINSAPSTWHMEGDLQADGDTQEHADRSYINKLPTLLFSVGKRMDHKEEVKLHSYGYGDQKKRRNGYYNTCAVCISEYEDGEMLKCLPACGHWFHKECIDMWLFSHLTCPLCRLGLFNHNGDLILHDEREVPQCDLEDARSTSTPSPTIFIRSHSCNDQSLPLGILDPMAQSVHGIRRASSHRVRRDDNRVHPIDSTS